MDKSKIEKAVWYNTYWCIDSNLGDVTIEVVTTERTYRVGDRITLKRGERIIVSIVCDGDNVVVPIVVTKTADVANRHPARKDT